MKIFRSKILASEQTNPVLLLNFDYYLAVCITQLCVLKAAICYVNDGHGCVQIKLYLQKQVSDLLPQWKEKQKQRARPRGCTLQTLIRPQYINYVLLDKDDYSVFHFFLCETFPIWLQVTSFHIIYGTLKLKVLVFSCLLSFSNGSVRNITKLFYLILWLLKSIFFFF